VDVGLAKYVGLINNKCETKLLFENNANAFIGLHCSLKMSSSLQNPQLTNADGNVFKHTLYC
jgi:predicted glycoside hydrolase/deacetylase ChbG (UPF0249 family)